MTLVYGWTPFKGSNVYYEIKEETKLLIKNKIDIVESLREDEFKVLIKLI